jgi:hypothetical protein
MNVIIIMKFEISMTMFWLHHHTAKFKNYKTKNGDDR